MSKSEFESLFFCEFKPDERLQALSDRLRQYYADTPDSMDNKTALPYYKEFMSWCAYHGYTKDEIAIAKRKHDYE